MTCSTFKQECISDIVAASSKTEQCNDDIVILPFNVKLPILSRSFPGDCREGVFFFSFSDDWLEPL